MDINQELDTYFGYNTSIYSRLGLEAYEEEYSLQDLRDYYWYIVDSEVTFCDNEDFNDDVTYSSEIKYDTVKRIDDVVAILCRDDYGGSYIGIFSKDKEVER